MFSFPMVAKLFAFLTCLFAISASAQIDPGNLGRIPEAKGDDDSTASDPPVLYEDPVWLVRINLGPEVNSAYSELFPIITPDGNVLFFTRKGDPKNLGAKLRNDEDIWYSVRRPDGGWEKAKQIDGPLNTDWYDGIRAINSTGTRLYLQNIYREDGTRGKGFSVSEKTNGSWSFPRELKIEDYSNDTTNSSLTISNDEETIILSVMRKDSKGGHDLYVSHHLSGDNWSAPLAITALNTVGDEISPFIAYDDRTVYYSTDGLPGLGMHDVFKTQRLDNTWLNWTEPRNLGSPVNTPSFDAYFMVTGKGDTAYFSSAHQSSTRGSGKSDIWKMALKPSNQPSFDLPTANLGDKSIGKAIRGQLFRLPNVLFDVGKSSIRGTSKEELDKLAELLRIYSDVRIEIQGHTDSDGDVDKNLVLSQNRADAVRSYLVSLGISSNRVAAHGFGETRPIAPNNTTEGKQLNRRVMVEVVE